MPLLVDPTAQRTALQQAAQSPAEGVDPGFIGRFKADFSAMREFSNINASEQLRAEAQSEFQRQFYDASGERLPNWLGGPGMAPRPVYEKQARDQFEAWKEKNPDSDLAFPSFETIEQKVEREAGAARTRSTKLQDRSTSLRSSVGGFLGTMAGALTDPINAVTSTFGAGAASGILRTALVEGAIGAGSETLIQAGNYSFKKRVDPDFSAGDAAYEIAASAAGSAVFGAGIKGLAGAWHAYRTGEWPRHIRDTANLVTREAAVPGSRFEQSAAGRTAHAAGVAKALDDVTNNRPVELPEETFLQANARPGRVYDADGHSVGVNYEVVDADSLVTSHRGDMSINPDFPQELQPRDRTRAISRDQVQSIAGNLQPERLGPSPQAESGAPIVGSDGLVESGNARVMAIRRAYETNGVPAENYRAYLRSQGFDIEGIKNPVLVARRVTDLDPNARIGFVTAANRSTALRLGASEQALADARLLDQSSLDLLDGADAGAVDNRAFVRSFMQKLPRAEQGALVDRNGVLSQEGERRIVAALMGRAYGEPALLGRALEDTDNNVKTIAGAMADAAAPWAKMRDAVSRGDIPAGMDTTRDLMEAVRLVMKARDEGRAVRDMVNQAEMFGGPNELAKIMARAMFGDEELKRPIGRRRLAEFLRDYATEAMKNDAGPRLIGEPLEAPDVLRSSLQRVGREDLEAVAAEHLTPENIQKIAESDDTYDAVIQEAQRIRLENPDVKIDLGDGERSLDDIFEEADDEISAAGEIEACATGVVHGE